ncbi:Uncharacterised protein [Klebsiella pneumoniae]|nr:Uncharacterised protein [Klebsiella pneumoniae]
MIGTDKHPIIVNIRFCLVLNRVGRYRFDNTIEGAIDGIIIGGNFHQRLLIGMNKCNIARRNPRFDQQSTINGDDIHQFTVRRDNPADGIHFDIFDDPLHR